LLGAQAVFDGATGRIRTGSARTVALLGLPIARTGRPQDRATIAGQFWPESGNGQALTNLRRELHDLRRILARTILWRSLPVSSWWRKTALGRPPQTTPIEKAEADRAGTIAKTAEAVHRPVLGHSMRRMKTVGGRLMLGWLL
jgi:hypothetical protein